jgi:hypothetical protein
LTVGVAWVYQAKDQMVELKLTMDDIRERKGSYGTRGMA